LISFTQQQTVFGDLSGNTSAANLARGAYLANIEQRYLLEKFFSNEASFSITTIGSQTLASTAVIASGAMSATLSAAWPYASAQASVTFTNTAGDIRVVNFIQGSTAITWQVGLSSATTTTVLAVGGVQGYRMPSDYSKIKTGTLTIGSLKWTPKEILTREQWDNLNVFPYYADIPNNFFIWNYVFNLWPIPSTTGNVISFNYKRRIPDLSIPDYNTDTANGTVTGAGTVTATNGSVVITGAGTAFSVTTNSVGESRYIRIPFTAGGDNLWYQIQSVDSTTGITLYSPYQGTTVAGAVYTVGQMPILMEDFQDMLIWKPLVFYYTSIVDNPTKAKEYQEEYDRKYKMLEEYAGSKTVNVNLSRPSIRPNPNLFPQNIGASN